MHITIDFFPSEMHLETLPKRNVPAISGHKYTSLLFLSEVFQNTAFTSTFKHGALQPAVATCGSALSSPITPPLVGTGSKGEERPREERKAWIDEQLGLPNPLFS